MKPKKTKPQKVVSIRDRLPSIVVRQAAVRTTLAQAQALPPDIAAVSGVAIAIKPDGTARQTAVMVEPEHVPVILSAMHELALELASFAAENGTPTPSCLEALQKAG